MSDISVETVDADVEGVVDRSESGVSVSDASSLTSIVNTPFTHHSTIAIVALLPEFLKPQI